MITVLETAQTVPLTTTEDGTIRIAGTRVSLDVVINKYKQGATAEQLAYKFPVLKLADIHAVLAWYLTHREATEAYLQEQTEAAIATRQFIEAHQDTTHIRERLLARQTQ
ncbi:MAG: DUF433 domain-containing protein [Acidobacteriota bacterium]|nr:DUF433 domain-containing protein [Acidobacteriota bacterium]